MNLGEPLLRLLDRFNFINGAHILTELGNPVALFLLITSPDDRVDQVGKFQKSATFGFIAFDEPVVELRSYEPQNHGKQRGQRSQDLGENEYFISRNQAGKFNNGQYDGKSSG